EATPAPRSQSICGEIAHAPRTGSSTSTAAETAAVAFATLTTVLIADVRRTTRLASVATKIAATASSPGSTSAAKNPIAPASVSFSPGAGSIGRSSVARARRAIAAARAGDETSARSCDAATASAPLVMALASPPDGPYLDITAGLSQLLPETRDEHLGDVRRDIVSGPPRKAIERLARGRRGVRACQAREDRALPGGEVEEPLAEPCFPGRERHPQPGDAFHESAPAATPQQRLRTGHQLLGLARLHDVVVCPEVEHADHHGKLVARREDEDRDVADRRKLADPPAHARAGTVAQHEVEHDELGRGLRRSSDRVVLARRGMDDEPRTHEVASHHRGDRAIILDDERRRGAGLLHLPLYASLQAAAILGPKPELHRNR